MASIITPYLEPDEAAAAFKSVIDAILNEGAET